MLPGLILLVFGARPAPAAEPAAGVGADAAPPLADLRPPELLEFSEAPYPAEALARGVEGKVGLALTLDAEGAVVDAEIVEPAGHGFDEAARAAALRFRFVPARRNDAPVAARIRYTYEFRLPEPAPSERAPAPAVAATPEAEPIDVTVRGASEAARLRRSAEAVKVIETEAAQRRTADLGEVLARSEGVGVRRGGGLGSDTRFSLNGLTDDQIRFFIDGVPLELAGFPFGIANVPVDFVERVEVYRGVFPIRFGADALGGAVNLVTDDDLRGSHGSIAYQAGSFGTERLALGLRHLDPPTGLFTRLGAFHDVAENDYPIDVETPDEVGRLAPARTYRFHDAYRATGVNLTTGFVDRGWARRLLLRAFATDYAKELQHNVVMTVPYGAAEFGELSAGASLLYSDVFPDGSAVTAIGGYTYGRTAFVDVADCVYDWFGRCVRERRQLGETESRPRDQVIWEHAGFARSNLRLALGDADALGASLAITALTRTGDERRQLDPDARDVLSAERNLLALVGGAEHVVDLFDDRLENVAFAKLYAQSLRSEDPLPGGAFRRRDRDTRRFGLGDSVRHRLLDWLSLKASYEWATRLPRPDEVFGDGVLIVANLELEPEVSHNANLGVLVDAERTALGALRADVNAFFRDADQLIVLLGNDRSFSYQNVYGARSVGIEAAGGWTSLGEHVALDANVTYQDFRNTSSRGTFGDFAGDRIPNRPYLFVNGAAVARAPGVAAENDELSLSWNTRYVHGFFRGWESIGLREYKQTVDAQLLHSAALGYLVRGEPLVLSFTAELQNLTNARAFDFYGVERPGRGFYFKTTAEL